jgi:hypothetical protein
MMAREQRCGRGEAVRPVPMRGSKTSLYTNNTMYCEIDSDNALQTLH